MSRWGKEADGRELGPGTCHSCDPALNRAPSFALTPRASLGLPCAPEWCLSWLGLLWVASPGPAGQALCPRECVQREQTAGTPANGGNMEYVQQMSESRHAGMGHVQREAEAAGMNDSCVHLSHEKSRGVEVRLRRPSGHHLDGAPPTGCPASCLELRAEAAPQREF